MEKKRVNWHDETGNDTGDTEGLEFGIYYLDENREVVDAEWFATEEERELALGENFEEYVVLPLACPQCRQTDQIFEINNVEMLYRVEGVIEGAGLEYGSAEEVDGSGYMVEYPLYCRNCEARWERDWQTGKTEMMPEWEPNNDK